MADLEIKGITQSLLKHFENSICNSIVLFSKHVVKISSFTQI